MGHNQIRDFIYLDTERVRSFSAQLFGGLPSERTTLGEHDFGAEGSAGGKVPFLASASGSVNYRYLKSQSETLSLHDHLFAEFFERLIAEHLIVDLTGWTEVTWTESHFKDGTFLFVTSLLKVLDYKANVSLLETLPETQNQIGKVTGGQHQSAMKLPGYSEKQQLQQMKPQIGAMSKLMAQFYGDMIRVKAFPFKSSPDKVLVGSADRTQFRYSPTSLTSLYGPIIDAGWTCVFQVNKGITHAAGAIVSSTGNQLEDAFEQLVDQFTTLSSLTQGVIFPAIAVTPIAIYREIS